MTTSMYMSVCVHVCMCVCVSALIEGLLVMLIPVALSPGPFTTFNVAHYSYASLKKLGDPEDEAIDLISLIRI